MSVLWQITQPWELTLKSALIGDPCPWHEPRYLQSLMFLIILVWGSFCLTLCSPDQLGPRLQFLPPLKSTMGEESGSPAIIFFPHCHSECCLAEGLTH